MFKLCTKILAICALSFMVSTLPCHAQFTIGFTVDGDSIGDNLGVSVSDAGDVNGDGFVDVIVGADRDSNNGLNSGSARVYSGADGSLLYLFDGDFAGDKFGISVSSAGDIDGDGFADVIIGAPGADNNGLNSGSARIFSGQSGLVLYTFNGDNSAVGLGSSVANAGDVNGDGVPDVIVGASDDDVNGVNSGSAQIFSGADGSILYTFLGVNTSDNFGYSVSGIGDANGDGFGDVIVGAHYNDTNGSNAGLVRVFSGADGSILYSLVGDSGDDLFGWSVSGAGDVNSDGFGDFIVGAWADDNNGDASGSARVFSGVDGSILYTFDGDSPFDFLGYSVSGTGDVNGDGFDDVIVGAPFDDNNGLRARSEITSHSGAHICARFDPGD